MNDLGHVIRAHRETTVSGIVVVADQERTSHEYTKHVYDRHDWRIWEGKVGLDDLDAGYDQYESDLDDLDGQDVGCLVSRMLAKQVGLSSLTCNSAVIGYKSRII